MAPIIPTVSPFEQTAIALLERDTPTTVRINGLRQEDVEAAWQGLFRFDAEASDRDRERWEVYVERDPDFKEPDDGVVGKKKTDRKKYLHWRPDLDDLLKRRGVTLERWQHEWFAHCERIHSACYETLRKLAQQMDEARPGFSFEKRVMDWSHMHCLRVLKYDPRPGVVARTHTDRCAVTLHLAESAKGLYAWRGWEAILCPTPTLPEAWCFTGQKVEKITRGAVPAVYHEVRDGTGGLDPRWAVVYFGQMPKDSGAY